MRVPRGDSSGEGGEAHGPLHPAMNRSLETLIALLFVFLLWSWFCYLVVCIAFFCLWGWYLVWSFSLSRLDPFSASCLLSSLSLSFSVILFVWCVRRRRLSLSLSLRRWGNPSPFGVWVSPCDSSSCARTSTSTRTFLSTPTLRHLPSPCFFLPPSVVFLVVVGLCLSGGCRGCGLVLVGWFAACICNALKKVTGQPDYHLVPQLLLWLCFGV